MPVPPIDESRLPRHIAITMDGNGRWATRRGLPRSEGHRQGDRAVRTAIESCGDLGTQYLTLYTFSTENWRRSEEEVQTLLALIEFVARREIQELHEKGERVRVLGRFGELPDSLRARAVSLGAGIHSWGWTDDRLPRGVVSAVAKLWYEAIMNGFFHNLA